MTWTLLRYIVEIYCHVLLCENDLKLIAVAHDRGSRSRSARSLPILLGVPAVR
jgi:hypothetical protein